MTPASIQALSAPISDEEPCGPDLELLGDSDYMRFVTRIEVVLPKSFASFDRTSVDFKAEFATLEELLARTRDLRLLVFLAKLHILNRDLPAFTAAVRAMEMLVSAQWEHVHPQLLDGDAILRVVSLQTLDDMPDSVMPLQSAPLFESRRFGKASYRTWLLASGQIQGRTAANDDENGEEIPSLDAVKTALGDADIGLLVANRGLTVDLRDSLARTEAIVNEKSGQPGALKYERLRPLAQDIAKFLDETVSARDPSQGLAPGSVGTDESAAGDDEPPAASGPMRSLGDARAAMAAAARYFRATEPSSPILLLIAQAEALIGKTFFEAMLSLVPDLSGQASIRFGREHSFRLPLERLSALTPAAEDGAADASGGSSPDDGWSQDSTDNSSDSTDSAGDGDVAESSSENRQSTDSLGEGARAHSAPTPSVRTRQDAIALLDQIAAYFRTVEPSSPIPLILEHARALAGRDFFGLLREVLPAQALKVDE